MVRMADASQPSNAISILYNGSYIEKLIDGVGREYRFTYKDATSILTKNSYNPFSALTQMEMRSL